MTVRIESNARRLTLIGGLAALLLVAGIPPFVTTPARAAAYTLWGSALGGWGFTQATINSPGPLLVVTQGERVDLTLFSADGFPHSWCIDYDVDNGCAPSGENWSGDFSSGTMGFPFSFMPTGAPGLYNYVCGVHTGITMNGPIRIDPPVKPVVSISSPAGAQRWTGGSTHAVIWTMTDPQDPVTSLQAWINYSTGGPWSPVAGPIQGTSNPHSVSWTLPVVNSTSTSVNVTVVDPAGNRGSAVQTVPVIDSRAPAVVGETPPNGSTGISTATTVMVSFEEAMNRSATGIPTTVAIQDLTSSAWIPVTYSWSGGDSILTLDPLTNLAPNTQHWVLVNASAMDASDPGNAIANPASWVFTTGCCADLIKPQISNVAASPPVAEYGIATDVTATIMDNDQVAFAYVNLTFPNSIRLNRSMAVISGNTWGWSEAYTLLGDYLFVVEAVDLSGNWNRSAQGTFLVEDTTPPVIASVSVSPSPAEVYRSATIGAAVSDPFLLDVSVNVEGSNVSATFNASSTRWERTFTPDDARMFSFTVWALDTSGNVNFRAGQLDSRDTTPPAMPLAPVVTSVGTGTVELAWQAVSAQDLAGYRLYRSTSESGPFTRIGPLNITGNAYVDHDVQPGTTYYYRVTSVDTRGHESMQSPLGFVTLPALPPDYTLVIVGAAAVAIIAALLATFLLFRRRRPPSKALSEPTVPSDERG